MSFKDIVEKNKEKRLKESIEKSKKQLERIAEIKKQRQEEQEKLKQLLKEDEEPKKGIRAEITDLSEKIDLITQESKVNKDIKKKAFRVPFKVKSQLKKLAIKSKVQVILLQNNGNIKPTVAEIKSGMIMVGDKIYDGSPKGLWLWNGKFPTMVVPEWDLSPLSRDDLYNKSTDNKRLSDPQTLIIRAMEFKESQQKPSLGGKTLIFMIIGGIIVFYILFANSGG